MISEASAAPAPDEPADPVRQAAVRGLEGAFAELASEFRRYYAALAEAASPGMLPGTFKILSVISRGGPVTASTLAERLVADKGMISRQVGELEELGLIQRTPDPHDGRVRVISVTPLGAERIETARGPLEGRLFSALSDWPLESIEKLTELLHALASGEVPEA